MMNIMGQVHEQKGEIGPEIKKGEIVRNKYRKGYFLAVSDSWVARLKNASTGEITKNTEWKCSASELNELKPHSPLP